VAPKDVGSTGDAGNESVASCAGPPARPIICTAWSTQCAANWLNRNTIHCYVSSNRGDAGVTHEHFAEAFHNATLNGRQLTYVVDENCVRCKIMDCVEVCPVDCFYEGENMLVIHPDECIDCGVCVPECPVDAIKPDTDPGLEKWLRLNAEYAKIWPNITMKKPPPPDSKDWEGKPDKFQFFSPNPGAGDWRRGPFGEPDRVRPI